MTITERICVALRDIGVESTALREAREDKSGRIEIAEGPIRWVV